MNKPLRQFQRLTSKLVMMLFLVHCASVPEGTKMLSNTEGGLKNGVYQVDAKKYRFDNGLTVILAKNETLPIYSYYTFYRVGSKHEKPGMTGSSHFLEHMMFKGAKQFGAGRFDKIIESNGGVSNAYTNYDNTVYYENMPKASLEKIIEVEADRMQNLLLEPQAFAKEKQVVLEERKMRYENSPKGQIYISMMNKIFKGTPYEVPVIGTINDIKTVSREKVIDYFKTFYAPNNATIVISGDLDYEDTISSLKKYFGNIASSKRVTDAKKAREVGFENNFKENAQNYYKGKSENPLFALAFPGVKYGERIGYVGDILSDILAGNSSSYLNQKYVETRSPLLSSIGAGNYTLQHSGIFYIIGEMIKPESQSKMKSRLLADFKDFCNNHITQRNVQKIKNQYLIKFYDELETNAGVANYLGTVDVLTGDFSNYIDEIKTYQSITTDEVKKACKSFLLEKNHYFVNIWKNNKSKLNL